MFFFNRISDCIMKPHIDLFVHELFIFVFSFIAFCMTSKNTGEGFRGSMHRAASLVPMCWIGCPLDGGVLKGYCLLKS